MTDPQQARFDGWAIVDVMGHQRYVGYVTTEAYGAAVLFRIDVPALEPRERVTKRPGHYADQGYLPAGTTIKEGAVDGYSKLVGSGSIYTITPCTKDAALAALEELQHRPLMSVSIPPGILLATTADGDDIEDDQVDDSEDDDDGDNEHDSDRDDFLP